MGQENLERTAQEENANAFRGLLAAFSEAGENAWKGLDFLDPEVELQDYVGWVDAGWHKGHEGALEWAVKLYAVFVEVTFTAPEVVAAAGNKLVFPSGMARCSAPPASERKTRPSKPWASRSRR